MFTQSENPEGLHQRYAIARADGSPIDPEAEYFVLRLDDKGRDPNHVAACRKAILAYADAIAPHLPKLASDIRARYAQVQPAPISAA